MEIIGPQDAESAELHRYFNRGEYEQVLLLWTRAHSYYACLSLNITREVCHYLEAISLIVFSGNAVREYTSLCTYSELQGIADNFTGAIFSRISAAEVLCIGRFPTSAAVSSVNIRTSIIRAEKPMQTKRNCPGVLKAYEYVYVFGGYTGDGVTESCEKFHLETRQWAPLRSMDGPRAYFNPVQYRRSIILANPRRDYDKVAMFNIDSEVFKVLPISLQFMSGTNICFLHEDKLFILGGNRSKMHVYLSKYQLLDGEIGPCILKAVEKEASLLPGFSCSDICAIEGKVCWASYVSRSIVTFDPVDCTIK